MVLASGGGTNLQAILDQLHGQGEVEVVGVGSDKPGAYALERAVAAKVPTAVFPRDEFDDREARDSAMADWIQSTGAELVALAGYMQLVSPLFAVQHIIPGSTLERIVASPSIKLIVARISP